MSLAGAGRSPQNYCRKAIPAEGAPGPHKASRNGLRPCRKAIPAVRRTRTHNKQNASFAPTRGQGTMSLAGAGRSPQNYCRRHSPPGAPEPHKASRNGLRPCRKAIPAVRRIRTHNKQNASFAPNRGQGTMSLAGAGRSPQNYCRKAIPAEGAPDPQQKQAGTACANRRQAQLNPNKQAARLALTAVRRSHAARRTEPQKAN